MWVVGCRWGGEEERKKPAPLTRQEGTVRKLVPELAVKALEYQAKDLGLDVVVSSGELLVFGAGTQCHEDEI